MKNTLLILLACTAVFAGFAVPTSWGHLTVQAEPRRACTSQGVVLETDVQSSHRCRLVVVSDKETVLDRGSLAQLTEQQELDGSYRFWQEPAGRVLYVYDDTQSLVCRVTNPICVTVLDVLE